MADLAPVPESRSMTGFQPMKPTRNETIYSKGQTNHHRCILLKSLTLETTVETANANLEIKTAIITIMTFYLAYTEDIGWVPLVIWILGLLTVFTGFAAIRSGWKNHRNFNRILMLHLFILIAVSAIGILLHLAGEVAINAAIIANKGLSENLQMAYDRKLLAEQNAQFAGIVGIGAALGAVAAIVSKRPDMHSE